MKIFVVVLKMIMIYFFLCQFQTFAQAARLHFSAGIYELVFFFFLYPNMHELVSGNQVCTYVGGMRLHDYQQHQVTACSGNKS